MTAETFNRTRRAYRLFNLMEEGGFQWFTVDASNMPDERLSPEETEAVEAWLAEQPWRDSFWGALNAHNKATIYGERLCPPPS